MLRVFLGRGIFATDGEEWLSQRKNASHLFKVRELKVMGEVFAKHGEELSILLEQQALGRPLDIQNVFSRLTFDAFAEIAYGVNFGALHDEGNRFCLAFNAAQTVVSNRILLPLFKLLGPFSDILPSEQQLKLAMKELHGTTNRILKDYLAAKNRGEEPPHCLLSRFVDENLSEQSIQEVSKKKNVCFCCCSRDFFIAEHFEFSPCR